MLRGHGERCTHARTRSCKEVWCVQRAQRSLKHPTFHLGLRLKHPAFHPGLSHCQSIRSLSTSPQDLPGKCCCAFNESKMSFLRSNLFWLCRIFITSCSITNLCRLAPVIKTISGAHNLSEQLHPSLHGVMYFDIKINPFK